MKMLAAALVLCSLQAPRLAPKEAPKLEVSGARPARQGGRWYLAESGHAVYCYGPVMTVNPPSGGLQKVATYCQGNQPMVPLHD